MPSSGIMPPAPATGGPGDPTAMPSSGLLPAGTIPYYVNAQGHRVNERGERIDELGRFTRPRG
eukprot:10125003-Lingulodinium_polyedra.AAC.1